MASTSVLQALGIALKLTFQGDNQLVFFETHFCLAVVVCCVITQMNYLNKVRGRVWYRPCGVPRAAAPDWYATPGNQ
jgi:hypothetical protein